MISTEKRFLFVHVPKTGGNSIQERLVKYSDDTIVSTDAHHDGVERFEVRNSVHPFVKHSTLCEYRKFLGPDAYDSLFKFAVLRNPWDRLISYYFSPHRNVSEWDRDQFMQLVATVEPLRHYVICEGTSRRLVRGLVTRPGRLDRDVDRILRFESLDSDFAAVCELLAIDCEPLPKRNRSSRDHYGTYYDDELVDLVARRFSDEIAFGGYKFGTPG